MVSQIYETFLNSEVKNVSIMMPNFIEHHKLEMWACLGQLQAVFEDLANKTTFIMISCITPHNRLEVNFKFHSDRIRTIAQLHDLSIPGRISEGQHSAGQFDTIYRGLHYRGPRMDWGTTSCSTKRASTLQHDSALPPGGPRGLSFKLAWEEPSCWTRFKHMDLTSQLP